MIRIRDDVNKLQSADGLNALIQNLAYQQMSLLFEKIYHGIFGSQIRLLEFMAVQHEGSASEDMLQPFFQQFASNFSEPKDVWSMSAYMHFLLTWQLLNFHEGKYQITVRGIAFIRFITMMNYQKAKSW